MSWDVFAFVAPPGVTRMDDVPLDYRPPSMGSRDEVVEAIRRITPDVDTSGGTWLVLEGPDHLIEVSLGPEDEVDGFTFFVRGGDGCVPLMVAIADVVGAALYDLSTGELMSVQSGTKSMSRWVRYRNQVTGRSDS